MRGIIAPEHHWIEYRAEGWQYGEAGILSAVAALLPEAVPKWCFECGCGDGTSLPVTCAVLINAGWSSVLADADDGAVDRLRARKVPGATVLRAILGPHDGRDIDALLATTPIPERFGVMVLDVDSCDLELWERMRRYSPAVVCIEYRHDSRDRLDACLMLGRHKGYVPLAVTWCNVIFARLDIAPALAGPEPVRYALVTEDVNLPGYSVIDADGLGTIEPGSADEIYLRDAVCMVGQESAAGLLRTCADALKPRGVLRVVCPDIRDLAARRDESNHGIIARLIVGRNGERKSVWCPHSMRMAMNAAGIGQVREWNASFIGDMPDHVPCVRLWGRKRWWKRIDRPKIGLAMSEPRLTFAGFHRCLLSAVTRLSARYSFVNCAVCSPFWEKALEQAVRMALDQQCDYILVADYDSVFTADDAATLIETLRDDPTLAAVSAVQMSRATGKPLLFTKAEDYGAPATEAMFHHFGLAVIRADVFRELPPPWLWSVPGPDGNWSSPLTSDADITFWRNLSEYGFRVVRRNDVVLGHIQECVLWPHPDGLMYQPLPDYVVHGRPAESRLRPEVYERRPQCRSAPQTHKIQSPTNCSRVPTPT